MSKLLASNFSRLKKNKVFWVECICMVLFGLYLVGRKYLERLKYQEESVLDNGFFAYVLVIGFAMAAFGSLFLGTEYSDGTIRNKLIVGHTRMRIYLANLIVSLAAGGLMCLCFIIPAAALGILLLGMFETKMSTLLWILLGSFLLTAAFGSIFTLFGMLCSNKAGAAAGCLLLVLGLFIPAVVVNGRLDAPEYVTSYRMSESEGMEAYAEPNPKYLTGTAREVYQFVYDFLPTGQAMQYSFMTAINLWRMPLYSLLISVCTTGAGVFLFRKKNIK